LDYYVYDHFCENPANQCFLLAAESCAACVARSRVDGAPIMASRCGVRGLREVVAHFRGRSARELHTALQAVGSPPRQVFDFLLAGVPSLAEEEKMEAERLEAEEIAKEKKEAVAKEEEAKAKAQKEAEKARAKEEAKKKAEVEAKEEEEEEEEAKFKAKEEAEKAKAREEAKKKAEAKMKTIEQSKGRENQEKQPVKAKAKKEKALEQVGKADAKADADEGEDGQVEEASWHGAYAFIGYGDFVEAQRACERKKGVAMPKTSAQKQALKAAMHAATVAGKLSPLLPMNSIWLGGRWNKADGQWEWSDGSRISDLDWAPGQPNWAWNQLQAPLLRMASDGYVHDTSPLDPPYVYGIMCEVDPKAAIEPMSLPASLGPKVPGSPEIVTVPALPVIA